MALTPLADGSARRKLLRLSARYGPLLLRLSLGLVLFWFGILKFFPGLSPADVLAERTIAALTFGVIEGDTARVLLATLETLIGAALLSGRLPRLALAALLGQMAGTLTPLVIFADEMWSRPLVPTMEGQYILKNMVLISAALALVAWALRPRLRATAPDPAADTVAPVSPAVPVVTITSTAPVGSAASVGLAPESVPTKV